MTLCQNTEEWLRPRWKKGPNSGGSVCVFNMCGFTPCVLRHSDKQIEKLSAGPTMTQAPASAPASALASVDLWLPGCAVPSASPGYTWASHALKENLVKLIRSFLLRLPFHHALHQLIFSHAGAEERAELCFSLGTRGRDELLCWICTPCHVKRGQDEKKELETS